MKKLLIILLSVLSLTISAEDVVIALLQPLTVEGSTACDPFEVSMVRGELRKELGRHPGYQVVTRLDVDAILKEMGFQQSGLVNDAQRKKVGDMTGAQYICVSTITRYSTQLYIEAYLVNVETGQMNNPVTQYAKIINDDYSTVRTSCNVMASEMLGDISSYSSKTSTSKMQVPAGYVDLGLPSGTLWKAENEDCGFITYDQAMHFYGSSLPTKEQLEELKNNCLWTWTGNGYKVKGKNGESIVLPAAGFRYCGGSVDLVGSGGYYWSSTPSGSEDAWYLDFGSGGVSMLDYFRCRGLSVRLVR